MPENRIALITGSNRGIGLAIADGLESKGLTVVRASRKAAGNSLHLDITSDGSVQRAAEEFGVRYDKLDVLVNNAGVLLDDKQSLDELDPETFMRTFDVNVMGAYRVTKAFLPYLKTAENARVINISSGLGQLSTMASFAPAYSVSKSALNALTIQQANHLRTDRIAVNCMCPGWVRTDMGGSEAPRSVEQGADTAIWLATEADHAVSGKFFRDREQLDW